MNHHERDLAHMKALVTGTAGFIGSWLAERLLDDGNDVVGLDSMTDYYSPDIKRNNITRICSSSRFTFIEADLLDIALEPLLDGIDWIFHQAAQPGVRKSWGASFDAYLNNNILATQRLLEAARDSKIFRFIYASSSSVYGDSPDLPLNEAARPQPLSPYGVTKLAAENLCHLYHVNYGIPTVSLRYFTVFGPRQRPDMAFHRFIRQALTGQTITIYGDGEQTRDFTYITDAVNANILAALSDKVSGGIFNIGGGSRISINKALGILRDILGPFHVEYLESQKGDVRHTMSDTTSARQVLEYKPEVSIEEGLARQVEWLRGMMEAGRIS